MNSSQRKTIWLGSLLGTISAALFAAFLTASPQADSPATEGRRIYMSNCSICHAKDGSANTIMGKKDKIPDLRSREVQGKTDADLVDIVANGSKNNKKMKPFKDRLTAREIQQVVSYLRELPKSQ